MADTLPDRSSASITLWRQRAGTRVETDDLLAVEEPLEIRLLYTDAERGRRHHTLSITMRTPGEDVQLALGFLRTEGLIKGMEQVNEVVQVNDNVIKVVMAEDQALNLRSLQRNFYMTSSCGICGKASLEALSMHGVDAHPEGLFTLSPDALLSLPAQLRKQQALFARSGGNHGVGLFDARGQLLDCHEDVGRHNAMDKLIGACLQRSELPLAEHGIIVSGRASFELLQKALMAGASMLIAVGAPSSLAVELAREFNLCLVGFVNERGFNIYHGEPRIAH